MRLRTKFAIVFVVVTLVLSGAILVALESFKRDAVAESRANVDETADLVAEQIDAAIEERRDRVGLVASRPRARAFDRSDQFLDSFLDSSRFFAAQIVAANGTVVGFRGAITADRRRAVIGSDRRNETYVRQALQGTTYVGEAEYVNRTDQHILLFSAPIFADGEVVGVLAAAIAIDEQTVFEVLPPLETRTQTVAVVDDGMTLHERDRTFGTAVERSATVDSTGWQVTVARDRTALDARLERLAIVQTGGLGLVVLVMIGFGYWQYTVSLRQTERLLEGFGELGAGNYDYTVSLRGGSEWEQMSTGFNDLAGTLQTREAALRERTQRLEVLYRVLRHNLRNQLSVIVTYADLITEMSADDEVVSAAGTILAAGRELTDLSETARQVQTALEGDPERTPIDVTTVVSEVVEDLRTTYPAVDVRTSLPETARVLGLPSLRFAIENVCANACEHNDSTDPRVEVSVATERPPDEYTEEISDPGPTGASAGTRETDEPGREGRYDTGGWVHVTVADNGPGIPEADRAAIREGRETDLEHGSGLGLWLAYWVVDRSGGHLEFRENEPRGAVVDIVLERGSPPTDDRDIRQTEDGTEKDASSPGDRSR